MIPREVLQKIRRIQISTTRLVTETFAGEYKSVFKGRGLEFLEVREYVPGDEVRSIDWNVSARMGRPFVKKHVEERELCVMLLLDASRSNLFGSINRTKRELAAEVCAVLAASAVRNNDKVGLIIFTDRIETYLPPRKGTRHVFRVIREALYHTPRGKGTDIPGCIEYLNRVMAKSAVVFLISDYYTADIKKPLVLATKRHDLVAVHITDPRDRDIPDVGMIRLDDAETGTPYVLDTSRASVRQQYRDRALQREQACARLFLSSAIDRIELSTASSYEDALVAFFTRRKKRRARRR